MYAIAALAGILAGLLGNKDLTGKDILQGGFGVSIALVLYGYIGTLLGLITASSLLGPTIASLLPGFWGILMGPIVALLPSMMIYFVVALATQVIVRMR